LTIAKGLKVGKHNALSGDAAPGRTGSSIDGEYSTSTLRLAMWPAFFNEDQNAGQSFQMLVLKLFRLFLALFVYHQVTNTP
jgi:hypothetical protein